MTNKLTFQELREANVKRLSSSRYVLCEKNWTPAHWMQATVGELGELANILKKVDRGDFTLESKIGAIADELADVQTYLDIMAFKLGVDLGQATVDKFNEISVRIGSNVFIEQSVYWKDSLVSVFFCHDLEDDWYVAKFENGLKIERSQWLDLKADCLKANPKAVFKWGSDNPPQFVRYCPAELLASAGPTPVGEHQPEVDQAGNVGSGATGGQVDYTLHTATTGGGREYVVGFGLAESSSQDYTASVTVPPKAESKPTSIELTKAEIQSGFDRVRWAEGLIHQLPSNHEGRNSWLLNYGMMTEQEVKDFNLTESAAPKEHAHIKWNSETSLMAMIPNIRDQFVANKGINPQSIVQVILDNGNVLTFDAYKTAYSWEPLQNEFSIAYWRPV